MTRMPGRSWRGMALGLVGGATYGIAARLVFDEKTPAFFAPVFVAMSVAFLFLVPVALGVVTVYLAAPARGPWRWVVWVFLPWGTCLLCLAAAAALALEGAICIAMAAPIFLAFSSVGGVAAGLLLREEASAPGSIVACVALLPFVVAPLEHRLPSTTQTHVVETRTLIHATPEAVWKNVVRVPAITPAELPSSMFERIGIPRPLEATLDRDGVGALRTARFEGDLTFEETVTDWEPDRTLAFSIAVDRATLSPRLLDHHVAVGGEYFDVLTGRFVLEPAGDGQVLLRLVSVHRLSTRFNGYAALWTDRIMADLQSRICAVICTCP